MPVLHQGARLGEISASCMYVIKCGWETVKEDIWAGGVMGDRWERGGGIDECERGMRRNWRRRDWGMGDRWREEK